MSWTSKVSFASGLGLGLLGALVAVNVLRKWRHRACAAERPVPSRPLRLYDTVKAKALANSENEHVFPFRSFRCVWLAGELGAGGSVEVERIDLQSEDAVSYREVHPHATLPAMKLDDGSVMLESGAICLYLAESFLDDTLLPEGEHTAVYYE